MSEVVQVTAAARRPIDATVTLPGSKSYTKPGAYHRGHGGG